MEHGSLKIIIAILTVGIAVSLFLNVYVLTRPSTISPTYVADMKVTDLDWMEQLVNASEDLCFVRATFNLTNLGNSSSALAELYLKICDPQGIMITSPTYIFHFDKDPNGPWMVVNDSPMTEATFYWQSSHPNPYSMSLFYHKPIGVETHVEVTVYGSVSNPQVKFNT